MTDKPQPDKFDWATELSDAQEHVTLSKQEAKEIGARLRSMGAKLKTYEDLGGAADDVQLLRTGYAAARLEIESLKAQLHAEKQINAAQFGLLAASIPGAALRPPYGQAPAAPPECKTEAERTAFALGWFKAIEQQQGDVLDAARYHYLRDVPMERWPAELLTAIRLQQNAKWDAAIDAARAAHQEGEAP